MAGPMQALLDEEEALKQKIKDRRASHVAAGYERRASVEATQSTGRSPTMGFPTEGRRASAPAVTHTGIASLMRPTASRKMQLDKSSEAPIKDPEEEETEETREKWDRFHHRSSVAQQDKEKYLATLRVQQEQREMAGCTFEPKTKAKSAAKSAPLRSGGSLFERAQKSEAKKQERMKKIRQENFDKEMAQCSFAPRIKTAPTASGDLGYDAVSGRSYAKRSSNLSGAGGGYDRVPEPCLAPEPRAMMSSRKLAGSRNCYGSSLADDAISEGSEGSELWNGEEEAHAHEETLGAVDVTLRPPARAAASDRPPRPPSQPAYVPKEEEEHEDEEDNAQLKVLQRLQERRRLLEETLSPDPASSRAFTFGAAASKSGAHGLSGAEPAAAVAEAVNRMEALLRGGLSDFEDDSSDEDSDVDDFDGVPVLGGKLQLVQSSLQLEGPMSVSRGGS